MRRGTRIFIAIAVAAITFTTLRLTVGSRYYSHWSNNSSGNHCNWNDEDAQQNAKGTAEDL
ncbi:MAG: hypothetical protein H7Y00_00885 [Fimbriimonadaceae bacterium]|nr:hypothetical protein [Chitinophagales bacterium]